MQVEWKKEGKDGGKSLEMNVIKKGTKKRGNKVSNQSKIKQKW